MYGYQFADLIYQIEQRYNIEFDIMQIAVSGEQYYYVLESKNRVDYAAVKSELDMLTEALYGSTSAGIYVMKHTYKNSLFTGLTREDRGACGIKLPVVLRCAPDQDQIETVIK